MIDKEIKIKIAVIITISLLLITCIITGYIYIKNKDKTNVNSQNDLYVVTKGETGFGISKINGKVVIDNIYIEMLRINNTVYLSNWYNS
ncbi:MAG: hypothetical protein RSE41_08765 [Clostridia bacterium]